MALSFLILSALTLAAAAAAMSLPRLIHCALALALAFAGLAGIYLTLGAEFIGLAQVLVYVGAVAILIVFAILLTRAQESAARPLSPAILAGPVLAAAVFAVLARAILGSSLTHGGSRVAPVSLARDAATVRQIGLALMDHYTLPLEILGLMLTAAMIGAVILAMKERPQ